MKNPILLLTALFISLNINLSAQNDYVPMESITDRQVAVSGFLGTEYYWSTHRGDTIIEGNSYRIIGNEVGPNIFSDIYLREDVENQKVYRYRGEPDYFEHLYYDFSLEVGGELEVYASGGYWYTYTVQSMDTISSALGPLRYWIFKGPVGPGFTYTEAVGGSPIAFETSTFISDPVFYTVCTYNKCQKITGSEDCAHPPQYQSSQDLEVSICEGETFLGHDSAGIYTDTLSSVMGCDSIINSTITVLLSPIQYASYELCPGEEIYGISEAGNYEITLPGNGECDTLINLSVSLLDSTDVECATAIKNLDVFAVNVFPNPANNLLNIEIGEKSAELNVYDFYGRQIRSPKLLTGGLNLIDIAHFDSGIFLVHIKTDSGTVVKKVLKQ